MAEISQNIIARADACAQEGQCALGVRYILDAMGIPNGRGNAHDYIERLPASDSDWMRVDVIRYNGVEYTTGEPQEGQIALSELTREELDDVLSNSPDVPPGAVIVYDQSADHVQAGENRYLAADRDRDGYLDRSEERYLTADELNSFDLDQNGTISNAERNITGGDRYGHVEIAVDDADGARQFVSDRARDVPGGSVPQNIAGIFIHPDLGGPDTREQIVAAATEDMRERIDNRRAGNDLLPERTRGIEDIHVPDLGGLDSELGGMFSELMMMVFGAFFQCIFNGMSEDDQSVPTRLDTPRQTGDPTQTDAEIGGDEVTLDIIQPVEENTTVFQRDGAFMPQ